MALRVELGGKVAIRVDGVPVEVPGMGRLGPPVFAYLVAERHRRVSRDELGQLLWGDLPPSSWQQMVRGAVATIRTLLRQAGLPASQVLTTEPGGYRLHLPAGTVVDVEAAAASVQRAEALLVSGDLDTSLEEGRAAAAIASCQFLPGTTGAWVERRQAEVRELHLRALECVAAAAAASSQFAIAIAAAEDAIALEPYRESAYLRLVSAHAGAGNRGEALRAYERCRRHLAEELGVGPSASTEALYLSLLGDEPAGTTSPPAAGLPARLAAVPGVLAGRDREIAQLLGSLKRAATAGPLVFLVAGEPGIGKTSLVGAFAHAAWTEGAHVLYGRCDEDLGVPYQPFAEAMDGYVADCPSADLQSHVATHGGELSRLTPALARRLPDTPAPPATEPDADRYRLFQAVAGLMRSAAEARPVVLVLDDIHWATSETLMLLRHLVRAGQSSGLLVVVTYRHTEVGASHPLVAALADLRREARVERLVLEGLDEDGVATIVGAADPALAGEDRLALVRAVHAHTAGNPFFAGELVRHLMETGTRYRRSGRWSYYDGGGLDDVPQGVRDVVSRRLRRLSDASNAALIMASVAGNEFALGLLERAVQDKGADEVLDAVEEAVAAHLLVEIGQGQYRFSHDLVRDTIYSGISTTRRCRLHRQLAEEIERAPHGRHGPPCAALAHHFAEAASTDCAPKAADYAVAAARQAIAVAAWDDAVIRLERGLEALDLQDPPDLERRCDLWLLLAETWMRFFDPERVLTAATQALAVARQLGSARRFGEATYWILRTGGNQDQAQALLTSEALDALGETETGLRAKLSALSIRCHPSEDRPRLTAAAIAMARRSQDQDALGVALMAGAASLRGSPSARQYLEFAEELVSGSPPDGWDAWRNGHYFRGLGRLALGDRTGFEADLASCARLGTERRFWFFRWVAAMWQATLALLDGRFADVEPLSADARAIAWRRGEEFYLRQVVRLRIEQGDGSTALDVAKCLDRDNAMHRSMLLFVASEQEDAEASRSELESFVDDDPGPMEPERIPVCLAYRTETAVALGGADRARRLYDQLYPYRGQVVVGGLGEACTGSADRYLGMLAASAGRRASAESHYKAALRLEGLLRSQPLLARTRHWYGLLLLESRRPAEVRYAHELLAASLATADTLSMDGLAAATRSCLEPTYKAPTPAS